MENEKNELGLLGRLYEKNSHGKFARPLITVMLCAMLATGCSPANVDPNDPNSKDPIQNEQGSGQGGEQYKGYSKLFNYLVSNYSSDIQQLSSMQYPQSVIHSGKYNNIPFTFLQSQGYDINWLKSDDIKMECSTFIKKEEPNNLYMSVIVPNQSPISYYDMYLLKYELTDQEMYEYRYMFDPQYITFEGCFINDAISAYKSVSIISHTKMSTSMYDAMQTHILDMTHIEYGKRLGGSLIIKDIDRENDTFTACIYGSKTSSNDKYLEIPLKSGHLVSLEFNGDIMSGRDFYDNKWGFCYANGYKNVNPVSIRSFSNESISAVVSVFDYISPYEK